MKYITKFWVEIVVFRI